MTEGRRKLLRAGLTLLCGIIVLVAAVALLIIRKTKGRTQVQINIHQNKELIHLSNFAEPPQFAIWLENPQTGELMTVFVTHRVAAGDWEGKANVPVALPQWFRLFRGPAKASVSTRTEDKSSMAVTGATPKEDYFSIRVEVKPGSEWICWIEMNLAGDFNEAFPEFDRQTYSEDEFSNGQPALLFRSEIKAIENTTYTPALHAQSLWQDGDVRTEPVSDGVTTARDVFDNIEIAVIRPKPKLVDKNKIQDL